MATAYCPKCQRDEDISRQGFCCGCGHQVAHAPLVMTRCIQPMCMGQLKPHHKVCPECGREQTTDIDKLPLSLKHVQKAQKHRLGDLEPRLRQLVFKYAGKTFLWKEYMSEDNVAEALWMAIDTYLAAQALGDGSEPKWVANEKVFIEKVMGVHGFRNMKTQPRQQKERDTIGKYLANLYNAFTGKHKDQVQINREENDKKWKVELGGVWPKGLRLNTDLTCIPFAEVKKKVVFLKMVEEEDEVSQAVALTRDEKIEEMQRVSLLVPTSQGRTVEKVVATKGAPAKRSRE